MSNIVISSRIRLARNLSGYPFLIEDDRAISLNKAVIDKLRKIDKFTVYSLSAIEGLSTRILSEVEALAMMERRLISQDLIKNHRYGTACINDDESISIMLNEEDHIREQCILSGLSLKEAYARLNLIDRTLGGELRFSFDNTYGYLTSCLTNLGTGMRASVMMFLPALALSKRLSDCLNSVSRLNMAVRGLYGEGSDSQGFIFQISNQKTMGISESEIIMSVESAARHLTEAELKARDLLLKIMPSEIKDRIMRSYGILTNCYSLTHDEFINLIAFVKLGFHYGITRIKDENELEELILEMSPANISAHRGGLTSTERDLLRAEAVRRALRRLLSDQT